MFFTLPRLDKEQGDGAAGVDSEMGDARVNGLEALLAAVSVAGVGAQCSDATEVRPPRICPNVSLDFGRQVRRPGESPSGS